MQNLKIEGREGAPWLMFSNSLASSLELWDEPVAALKDRFRILRYDTRGHGKTPASPPPYAMDQLVTDAAAAMDAAKATKVHFVGMSLGGMVGMGLALKHPQRLASLAVCDSRADMPAAVQAGWDERIGLARSKGMEAMVEPTLQRWFPAEFLAKKPPVLDKVRAMIRATAVDGFVGCAEAIKKMHFLPELHRIALPTLFLVGGADGGAPPAAMRDMQSKVKGARFVELPGAGHLCHLEQPERFTRELSAFLADVAKW